METHKTSGLILPNAIVICNFDSTAFIFLIKRSFPPNVGKENHGVNFTCVCTLF